MLPFLKPKDKSVAGLIIKTRTPDEKPEDAQEDPASEIHECSQALIHAVHAQDVKAVSQAIKDAFDILDSMPHEEGEHISPHTYEDQKED